jgi:predicted XRE-type DNA-binding protein
VSSGNAFTDLGVPEAGIALAKADLAHRVCAVIGERKLTQTRAAAVLSVTQPKASDLMRGKLDGFTVDRLLRFLNRLDQDVEIAVSLPAEGRRQPAPASCELPTPHGANQTRSRVQERPQPRPVAPLLGIPSPH